ncbi:MAG: class I SAM-dependent rRNA methyltransferase [bacterium]
MSTKGTNPLVVLRQGRDISVRRRHPWVFSGAIAEKQGTLQNGCLVEVRSKDGSLLGCGHWGTRGIAVRMLSFRESEDELLLIREKITSAINFRRAIGLLDDPQTTGFRLVHGEGDELPGLVIDLYGETAVVQGHSHGMWRLKESIDELLRAEQQLKIKQVVFRRVEAQLELDEEGKQPEMLIPEPPQVVAFSENGLRFIADVTNGQKTGFFLDQRVNRAKIRGYAKGKHMLNAFCYTGAFSVYGFAGGAESVVSVDASKSAIDLCRQNVVANFASVQHHSEVADCFSYLTQIPDTFDLIVLDPPAFAKHQRAVQRALHGYETINALALKHIKPGGLLVTFSCSQLVSRELFRDAVMRAAAQAERSVRIVEVLHQAPCHPTSIFHPEGDYLKGLVLYVE